ncbi:MAG: NADH-quinone oxidoreductase subunit H [Candidatus Odinarchaeota archaeon]|nr:NADH-quinone oxidoreductase subunit H [Candidatus Odinarchaeota archaeon]
METIELLILILKFILFPGALFCIAYGWFLEWFDRKLYARFQNRIGPLLTGPKGVLQPFADFIKLLAKEDITPAGADKFGFTVTPLLTLVVSLFTLLFIPIASLSGILSLSGDLLLVLFISTVFGLLIMFAGYFSGNRFSIVGTERTGLQFVAYEIPFALSVISVALATRSLEIVNIVTYQVNTLKLPLIVIVPVAFIIYLISSLAKLEKIPFDVPEAETEIVAGWQVEYSGKKLAFFRLATDLKMVFVSGLAVALFLGGPYGPSIPGLEPVFYTIWFIIKTLVVMFILSNLRSLFARYRIDQVVRGFWKYLIPFAVLQILAVQLLIFLGVI